MSTRDSIATVPGAMGTNRTSQGGGERKDNRQEAMGVDGTPHEGYMTTLCWECCMGVLLRVKEEWHGMFGTCVCRVGDATT